MTDTDQPGRQDWGVTWRETRRWTETTLSYRFTPHFHPYADALLERLANGSVRTLQEADTAPSPSGGVLPNGRPRPELYQELFQAAAAYKPTGLVPAQSVPPPGSSAPPRPLWPVAELDFSLDGAYSVYNWELFFHIPVTIAVHLSRNGRFEDAQRWFHFVFDPTTDENGPAPQRFWKTAPFRTTDVESIDVLLTNLSALADEELFRSTLLAIQEWQRDPFRPHLVARLRPSAYMAYTFMAYLDNLIAWGDALFAQDTGESVAEATQLYVLAANLLGTRPQQVPTKGTTAPQTYASLRQRRLDAFSNAMVTLETTLPFARLPVAGSAPATGGAGALGALGQTLYFCVPPNEKLLGYWDTVADRLFKIRNSLSLAGVFRQLPTFDPPIDPALLARAAAAGLDAAAIVAGVNQPAPLVRFQTLLAKAGELCQEVKGLGAALLSAIEKQDGEALGMLRAQHEVSTLELARTVKFAQWQEAVKSREALEVSISTARARHTNYQRLLGVPEGDISYEDLTALDVAGLATGRFTSHEPVVEPGDVDVDIDPSAQTPGGGPAGGHKISSHEASELKLLHVAQLLNDIALGLDQGGAAMNMIPDTVIRAAPFGVGTGIEFGGVNIAGLLSGLAAASRGVSARLGYEASRAAKVGGYARREQEWQFQRDAAAGELTGLNKQLRAAQIREFVARREVDNQDRQIRNAKEVQAFLAGEKPAGKVTTTAYYALLRREVRGLYNQCYELAVETARKAERALRNELGDPTLSFIRPSYLAGPEGLLAGEKLHLDLRRMELAHLDLNRREYELTKHVSLLQLDPAALMTLRVSGRCTFAVPEECFDLDTPGHYFRRLRSVAISIPCVTGPYTGIACSVRMLRSRVRTSPLLPERSYPPREDGETRFDDQLGSTEAIVTSTGTNDGGLFDGSGGDGRLLPFEYRGVISEWELELPSGPRPFDYDTITDLVMTLRYTAREGGRALRQAASDHLLARLGEGTAAGSVRLLSVRHEFPTAWSAFKATTAGNGTPASEAASTPARPRASLAFSLRPEHYPFLAAGRPIRLVGITVLAKPMAAASGMTSLQVSDLPVDPAPPPAGEPSTQDSVAAQVAVLTQADGMDGYLRGELGVVPPGVTLPAGQRPWLALPHAVGELRLCLPTTQLRDIVLLLHWRAADGEAESPR